MHLKPTTAYSPTHAPASVPPTDTSYSSEYYACDYQTEEKSCKLCHKIIQACIVEQTDRDPINEEYVFQDVTGHANTRYLFVFFAGQTMRLFFYDLHENEAGEEIDNKRFQNELESVKKNLKKFGNGSCEIAERYLPFTTHLQHAGNITYEVPPPPEKKPTARCLFADEEPVQPKRPDTDKIIFLRILNKLKESLLAIKESQMSGPAPSRMLESSPQAMASELFATLNRLQRSLPQTNLHQDREVLDLISDINRMRSSFFIRN